MTDASFGTYASRWQTLFRRRLMLTDTLSVLVAVFGSQALRYGLNAEAVEHEGVVDLSLTYTGMSTALSIAWLVALSLFGTRAAVVVGSGVTEYKRVVDATLLVFGVLAIVCYLLMIELGRGYFLLALPLGLLFLVLTRWSWRLWLGHQRQKTGSTYVSRSLLVGERSKSEHVLSAIRRDGRAGLFPVAAITIDGDSNHPMDSGFPVLGGFDRITAVLDSGQIDTVIYTGSDTVSPARLRRLGWELEKREISLVVAPSLTDIAGPRIHARPVAGLPLIHVATPKFEGRKYWTKRLMDMLGSGLGLLALSPVFLVLSIAIKRDSAGPIFFRQDRVGLGGEKFKMIKFRSMIANAEDQLPSLLDSSEGNDILFKMKNDPRVTKLGAFMRRYSIDELPQLINVFIGQMALVGPRPPLQNEVDQYEDAAHRRFLVKPGMTGLWQVSGRSNLSWDDSLRLDLYYVENWTVTGDLIILWRTARAVVGSDGAY